jgi:hypothetical protein
MYPYLIYQKLSMGGQMELKHDDKKEVRNEVKVPKVRAFAGAIGLTAGLALVSCAAQQKEVKMTEQSKVEAAPVMVMAAEAKPISAPVSMEAAAKVVAADQARREKFLEGLEKRPELDSGIACVLGMPRVCFANKVVLEAGDTFLTVGMVMEKGYFAFNISKVDEKGIEVAGTRFSFGETKPLVGSAGSPTLTVEKGPKPGTAIVTVSFGSQGSQ